MRKGNTPIRRDRERTAGIWSPERTCRPGDAPLREHFLVQINESDLCIAMVIVLHEQDHCHLFAPDWRLDIAVKGVGQRPLVAPIAVHYIESLDLVAQELVIKTNVGDLSYRRETQLDDTSGPWRLVKPDVRERLFRLSS